MGWLHVGESTALVDSSSFGGPEGRLGSEKGKCSRVVFLRLSQTRRLGRWSFLVQSAPQAIWKSSTPEVLHKNPLRARETLAGFLFSVMCVKFEVCHESPIAETRVLWFLSGTDLFSKAANETLGFLTRGFLMRNFWCRRFICFSRLVLFPGVFGFFGLVAS